MSKGLTQATLFAVSLFFVAQPKEKTAARPKTLAQLRMQLKAEREAEGQSHPGGGGGETWTGAGPAAKSHLTELTRLMEGAQTEAGKNFSQLLQKLDNIKQARCLVFFVCASECSVQPFLYDIPLVLMPVCGSKKDDTVPVILLQPSVSCWCSCSLVPSR